MARVTIDFSEVESFAAIPEDEYAVVVEEVEMREGDKAPYLNWKLKVTEGEFEGRFQWMMTSLSPKALWRLKETLENLGIVEEEFELEVDEDTNLVIQPELVGLAAIAPVTVEEYQGKDSNRVDILLPPSGGTATPKKTTTRRATAGKKTTAASKPAAARRGATKKPAAKRSFK
jgi:hypothetical protein